MYFIFYTNVYFVFVVVIVIGALILLILFYCFIYGVVICGAIWNLTRFCLLVIIQFNSFPFGPFWDMEESILTTIQMQRKKNRP